MPKRRNENSKSEPVMTESDDEDKPETKSGTDASKKDGAKGGENSASKYEDNKRRNSKHADNLLRSTPSNTGDEPIREKRSRKSESQEEQQLQSSQDNGNSGKERSTAVGKVKEEEVKEKESLSDSDDHRDDDEGDSENDEKEEEKEGGEKEESNSSDGCDPDDGEGNGEQGKEEEEREGEDGDSPSYIEGKLSQKASAADQPTKSITAPDHKVLWESRCKLFRYDKQARVNKERGVGVIQLLQYFPTASAEKGDGGHAVYRVLMLRDQTHQVCADFPLFHDFHCRQLADSPNVYQWACTDFSEGQQGDAGGVDGVVFTARFRTEQIAEEFANKLNRAARSLPKPTQEQLEAAKKARIEAEEKRRGAGVADLLQSVLKTDTNKIEQKENENVGSSSAFLSQPLVPKPPGEGSTGGGGSGIFGVKVAKRTLSFANFSTSAANSAVGASSGSAGGGFLGGAVSSSSIPWLNSSSSSLSFANNKKLDAGGGEKEKAMTSAKIGAAKSSSTTTSFGRFLSFPSSTAQKLDVLGGKGPKEPAIPGGIGPSAEKRFRPSTELAPAETSATATNAVRVGQQLSKEVLREEQDEEKEQEEENLDENSTDEEDLNDREEQEDDEGEGDHRHCAAASVDSPSCGRGNDGGGVSDDDVEMRTRDSVLSNE